MRVDIKGKNIVLSETPIRDVLGALLFLSPKLKGNMEIMDVKKGQKTYKLPDDVEKKDVDALYLRVL